MTGQQQLAIVTVAWGVLHLVWGPFGVHFVRSSVGARFSRRPGFGRFCGRGFWSSDLAWHFASENIYWLGTSAGENLTPPPGALTFQKGPAVWQGADIRSSWAGSGNLYLKRPALVCLLALRLPMVRKRAGWVLTL